MPLPRKNVSRNVRQENEDLDIVVTARKPPMFDWDDMGLGLEIPLTTSDSEHSNGSLSQGTLVATPKPPKPSKPSKPTKSTKKPPTDEAQIAAYEWVRNLIECRKETHQRISPDDHGFRMTGKGWLLDQHKALEDGSIPVTFKCIIAASGISKAFSECRDTFMRPEYRSRYWSWSVNFILLIDYYIDHGNIRVTEKAAPRYHPLIDFLKQCKAQKNMGNLAQQRDYLLSAMGIVWDKVQEQVENDEEEGEISDESSVDNQEDETWQMPSKHKLPAGKKAAKKRSTRKRKRRASSREKTPRGTGERRPESPPRYPLQRPAPPTRDALCAWARKILTLRCFHRKQTVEDETYDIPASRVPLRIWMNAEVGRCSAGILSEICSSILLAAEMADRTEVGELSDECEAWGKGFVAYIDYVLRKGRPLQVVIDFLYDCRKKYLNRTLAPDRDALLSGVDQGWLESKQMKTCVFQKEKARSERIARLSREARRTVDDSDTNGHYLDVVRDYDSSVEESGVPKKRKKTANLVRQMLTSMIGGEVAVTVEGRNPTAAERRAKEWVLSAGAETFDAYARNWFRAAASE